MADQKALKKRLKALMARPDNQICSDCPEKKPTWASLIVPPPGSPPGTTKIGAFCCLECSGSHRRLGVHISFVRSVNLDSWKEDEVRAMENGGNAVVNSIFEARLAQSGAAKPTNLADGPTRERFIRDKYERRKYFDPAGYSNVGMPNAAGPVPPSPTSGPGPSPSPSRGTPSDVARQRVASRQARMRTAHSQMEAPTDSSPPTRPNVAPAPVSAPVVFDLLDFGEAPATATPAPAPVHDPFAPPPPTATSTASATGIQSDPFAVPQVNHPSTGISHPQATTQTQLPAQQGQVSSQPPPSAFDFMTPTPSNPPPSQPKSMPASNDSILALFNKPPPQTSFIGVPNSGFTMTATNSPMPINVTVNANGNARMPQQNFMMNQNMMGMQGTYNMQNFAQQTTNNSMMMQNMNMNMNTNPLVNPQYQGNMMGNAMYPAVGMPNQQSMMGVNPQQKQQQQQQFMAGGMMNGSNNNMNFNSMMHGMQQLNVGMGNQHLMGSARQFASNGNYPSSDDGGFGTPMGSGATTAKSDPFSSLGGMNAFR